MKHLITTKKIATIVAVLLTCITVFSCKTRYYRPYPTKLSGQADSLVNRDHFIDSATAAKWIQRYQDNKGLISNNSITKNGTTYNSILPDISESFNRGIFEKILDLDSCIGIHIYFGMDDLYQVHLLLSGTGPNYETLYIDGTAYILRNDKMKQKGGLTGSSGSGMGEYGMKP